MADPENKFSIKIIPARDRSGDVIKTAAYARVSSDSDDQLNSFSAQIRHYTELLTSSPDTVFIDMYADEGISGTGTEKRADFNRLMNDCRKGKIDRILTKSISRFARNTRDCLEAIRELKQLGISVYFEKEDIDTGEISSELMLTLYSQFAQEESISISKNCRIGVHKRMMDGTYINASVAYGYHFINGIMEIDEEKAPIVREIFDSFLNGDGTETIARRLNRQGVPVSQYGKKWHHTAIMEILRNERYIGDSLFQKNYSGDALPFRMHKNRGEKPQYYAENTHPAIIPKEIFEAAQRLVEHRKVKPESKSYIQYPLSKMVYCGQCGTLHKRKEHSGRVYWVCRKHDESAVNCPARQIPEAELSGAFVRMFNKMTAAQKHIIPPMIRQLKELTDRKIAGNSHIIELRREISDIKEQIHLTATLKTDGLIDNAYFTARNKEFDIRLTALQKQLRALSDSDREDEQIAELKQLENILAGSEPLTEFDELKFAETISKITVLSDTEIQFTLIGGLEISEKISGKGRR